VTPDAVRIEADGADALVWVKAVPGAAREAIAGAIGDRIKVKVSAPPEGGKANRAICALLAAALGVKPRDVTIERGHGHPEKVVRVAGTSVAEVRARLG
jgi:uncharacterized protein (TIGR00251 family)